MERHKLKEKEAQFLAEESKKNPEFFRRETFTDSPDFLEKIGIFFESNKNLPKGYLKLWPQDFIVEEISINDGLQTINSGDLFRNDSAILPEDPTIYATLVKCKLPTLEAAKEIALTLAIDQKKVQYAGIKDTDAITSQLISIRDAYTEKLKNISSPYYFLKNIHSGKGVVEVGSLKGNKFTILIRTSENFDKEQFLKNVEEIKNKGFFNFFYLQRFGSPRFINWFWGLLILRGEYKNAVESFLCSAGQREMLYFKNLRRQIKEDFGNWSKIEKIIEKFPIIMQNELSLVRHLKKHPEDFSGALKTIEDQVKLWVFAYGSLLFNRKISEYIETGEKLPEKLPLILSKDKKDWILYYDFLKEDKISSMPLKNLSPFPDIQWKKREIKTSEKAKIHKTEFIKEGVVMSFSLDKGCYATTFLSHFFQLMTGMPPKDISDKVVDIKEILGEKPIEDVIKKFESVTFSKSEDIGVTLLFGKTE